MKRRRKFYNGVVNHVYQHTVGGVHLFYTMEDCLVFLSILSVCVRSSNVRVLELCLMHNHIHLLIIADKFEELSSFMQRLTSWYAMVYNAEHGRKGQLFKKNFGSAPKWDMKKQRSAAIYVGNNPVEKGFCKAAEECRWNFLVYAKSDHPFSKPMLSTKSSRNLKACVTVIDSLIDLNLPLRYPMLSYFRKRLDAKEYNQLVDYIIARYLPLDYEGLISMFKSYEDMIMAMYSTTGDEFEIKEERDDFSLTVFNEMMRYMRGRYSEEFVAKMISLPLEEKFQIASELRAHTCASSHQICKFLHIPIQRRANRNMRTKC